MSYASSVWTGAKMKCSLVRVFVVRFTVYQFMFLREITDAKETNGHSRYDVEQVHKDAVYAM